MMNRKYLKKQKGILGLKIKYLKRKLLLGVSSTINMTGFGGWAIKR